MKAAIEILNGVADDIVARVIEMFGESGVHAVFLSGSVVDGIAIAGEHDGQMEIYSDIDLYVVVTDIVDLDLARRSVSDMMQDYPLECDGYRMLKLPDVGVFNAEDLSRQPVRPGTVEVALRRRELCGDASQLVNGRFVPEEIEPDEALYLIENRLLEISDACAAASRGAPETRFANYVILKCGADIATALLVAVGAYEPGREARSRVFESDKVRAETHALLPEDTHDQVVEYTRGMIDASSFASEGTPRRDHVERLASEVWLRIARRIYGSGDVAGIMARRLKGASPRANVREMLVLGRRAGMNRLRMALCAGTAARFSTVDILRVAALVDVYRRHGTEDGPVRRLEVAVMPALDRLTRLFGFDEGDLVGRARAVRRLVGA